MKQTAKIPVLVVEDHESTYRGLKLIVDEIANIDWVDQMESVKSCSLDKYSCVILDLGLPEPINGLMVLRYIKNCRPNLPVIVVSGHSDIRLVKSSMQMGVAEFLEKPVDANRLTVLLSELSN